MLVIPGHLLAASARPPPRASFRPAAGAVAGALIGSQYDNRGRTEVIRDEGVQEREVRRCRDIDQWVNRITGYRVTYEYAGRRYSSFMPNDPGREVKVRVSVEPQS